MKLSTVQDSSCINMKKSDESGESIYKYRTVLRESIVIQQTTMVDSICLVPRDISIVDSQNGIQ